MRRIDGALARHENQCFFKIKEEFNKELEELFEDTLGFVDDDETEYTLGQKSPETGFIINSKVKDGETTPMRDVKDKVFGHLSGGN